MLRKISSPVLSGIAIVYVVFFLNTTSVQAHPHVFIDAKIKVYFDAKGLKGFKISWQFDQMFSEIMLDEFDEDVDDEFSAAEQKMIYQKAFSNLKKFGYFTKILIDNKPFEIKYIANFEARMDDDIMSYSFFIPCSIPINDAETEIKVFTYDESYYMDVSLTEESISFVNTNAYEINYEVYEDDTRAYYFNQIYPFALRLSVKRK
ncbi:MAG: hypothetical protein DSY76_02410 [Bacteroidetes bacterium]|nr:MAG: hypothetical protein DSY76_02410 [Bacteroidota bacterium]